MKKTPRKGSEDYGKDDISDMVWPLVVAVVIFAAIVLGLAIFVWSPLTSLTLPPGIDDIARTVRAAR